MAKRIAVSEVNSNLSGAGMGVLSTGNIPRGVFCKQSSQKTRELRREIMQSVISVHGEACCCDWSEQ